MKLLMFDYRESEKKFFEGKELRDFEIKFIKEPLNENTELSEEDLRDTDIVSVFTTSNLSEKVLSRFHNLRIVSTRSTAFSHIDTTYCTNHNIAVFNVDQYGSTSVAQYAIALIIALIRNMLPAYLGMKHHEIDYTKFEGKNLDKMTIGVIGCGAVGSAVAKIAKFFGMRVLIHSYMKNPELNDSCDFVTLDELLCEADIITLHIPYNGENYHMIGKEEFNKMKDGVYIVNTARGELLDIAALYDNITSGKVRGAGLDVLECEFFTTHPQELTKSIDVAENNCVSVAMIAQKLFNHPNVIITPHIGYNTTESVNYILDATFNNIRDYIKGMYVDRVC